MAKTGNAKGLTRHEEELAVGSSVETIRWIRAQTRVEVEAVSQELRRNAERPEVERVSAKERDSGVVERLPAVRGRRHCVSQLPVLLLQP